MRIKIKKEKKSPRHNRFGESNRRLAPIASASQKAVVMATKLRQ